MTPPVRRPSRATRDRFPRTRAPRPLTPGRDRIDDLPGGQGSQGVPMHQDLRHRVAALFPTSGPRRTRVAVEQELLTAGPTGACVPIEEVRAETAGAAYCEYLSFEPGGQVELSLPCANSAPEIAVRLSHDVDALRREIENLVAEFDLDLDFRPFPQERRQPRQDAGARERGGGGHAHPSAIVARDLAERGLDTGETFDQRASRRHEPVALLSERQRMGGAMQKPQPVSLFEAGDRLGHRRGGRPRPPRGFGEGARLDDADEGEETREVGR